MAKTAEEIFMETFIRRSPVKIKEDDFKKDREVTEAIVECMDIFAAQEVEAYIDNLKKRISARYAVDNGLNLGEILAIIDLSKHI